MIDQGFLQKIGLTGDQITLLRSALDKESKYRQILLQEDILPGAVEKIVRKTKLEEVDLENEALLREKIRVEWADFIPDLKSVKSAGVSKNSKKYQK